MKRLSWRSCFHSPRSPRAQLSWPPKRGAPICSCLSWGAAVPSQEREASVPHRSEPCGRGSANVELLGAWGVSHHADACGRLLSLTWGAEGAHTPPLLFFSSPLLAHGQGERGEEVPEGSLPVLPGGLHAEVLLLAPTRPAGRSSSWRKVLCLSPFPSISWFVASSGLKSHFQYDAHLLTHW